MPYNIALQFEDGVTRVIPCDANELVSEAAYRAKINIPLDCRDGACGTCKCHCESGTYTQGVYIEDALTDEEAEKGYVLTCQMKPSSDCVIKVPASSAACKTEVASYETKIAKINRDSKTTVSFTIEADRPVSFLPGQYVNLGVPGTQETRAYSFSSAPNSTTLGFLIRDVPNGLMSTYMRSQANVGDAMSFTGPYGSFYLRPVERPVLMLAGGTGLAPFLSMLLWLKSNPTTQPIMLAYGVNTNDDLVELDTAGAAAADYVLSGGQAVESCLEIVLREFQRLHAVGLQTIEPSRVFEHGRIAARVHVGQDVGYALFDRGVGVGAPVQAAGEGGFKIRLGGFQPQGTGVQGRGV